MSTADRRAPLAPDGRVLVVGAGLGGLRCAEALRAGGFAGTITLIGDEPIVPYDRPPLTKQVLAGRWDAARIALTSHEKLEDHAIEVELGATATGLDVAGRSVRLDDGRLLRADAVVLATGAHPRRLAATDGLAGVHVVRTLDDSLALRAALVHAGNGGRLVVIGAGFIGAEVASCAAALGMRVTILEALAVPLSRVVGDEMGTWLARLHHAAGIEVRTKVAVAAIDHADGALGVALATGERIEADVVVVGIGVAPTTAWLEGSGLDVDDGVVTDGSLFAADGIVAIGDLARFEWHHAGTTERVRIEHWEVTQQLAIAAATSLLAGRDAAPTVSLVPYFWSDQHRKKIQMLGRPSGDDEALCVAGSIDDGAFTTLYARDGVLTGVLGLASPRNVMRCRPILEAGGTLDDARALFA